MARMITTTQKKNSTRPGMANPLMVLALATTASYPPMPDLIGRLAEGCCAAGPAAGDTLPAGSPDRVQGQLGTGVHHRPQPGSAPAGFHGRRAGSASSPARAACWFTSGRRSACRRLARRISGQRLTLGSTAACAPGIACRRIRVTGPHRCRQPQGMTSVITSVSVDAADAVALARSGPRSSAPTWTRIRPPRRPSARRRAEARPEHLVRPSS